MRRITSSYYNYFYKSKAKLLSKIVLGFKYNNPDELFSIAKIQLLYSMIHFDKSLGCFSTYLYIRIRGNILRHISSEEELCKNLYGDNLAFKKKYLPKEDGIMIEEMLGKLSERERKILTLYYIENNTLREISEKLNISSNCVFTNKNKALEKIREIYAT